jgi:hypothetical protein
LDGGVHRGPAGVLHGEEAKGAREVRE